MRSQSLKEILREEFKEQDPVIGSGIMFPGTKAILYGQYKAMKSMLAAKLAHCVATGQPWIGFDTPHEGLKVLYVQLEIPKRQMQSRLRAISRGFEETSQDLLVWTEHYLKLDTTGGMGLLRLEVEEAQPGLLIIDPIYKVMSGDMMSAREIQNLLDSLDKLLGEFPDMSLLLVSHTRKGTYDDWGSDDMIGSVIFSAWADSIIKIERGTEKNVRVVKFEVVRHAEQDIEPVEIVIDAELRMQPKEFTIRV